MCQGVSVYVNEKQVQNYWNDNPLFKIERINGEVPLHTHTNTQSYTPKHNTHIAILATNCFVWIREKNQIKSFPFTYFYFVCYCLPLILFTISIQNNNMNKTNWIKKRTRTEKQNSKEIKLSYHFILCFCLSFLSLSRSCLRIFLDSFWRVMWTFIIIMFYTLLCMCLFL